MSHIKELLNVNDAIFLNNVFEWKERGENQSLPRKRRALCE